MDYNYDTDNGAILPPNFIPYIRYLPNPIQNDNTTDLGVDSIDAADYDYELDTYDAAFPGSGYLDNIEYLVYDANPDQSDNTTDVKILTSVDAAAASLQLGTNNEETQAIEISSNDVTTTIYGPVTMLNMLNASSIELTTDLNVSGRTTLMNVSTQALTATSFNCDTYNATRPTGEIYIGGLASTTYAGGTVTIGDDTKIQTIKGSTLNIGTTSTGSVNIGTSMTGTGAVNIGTSSQNIVMNATNIKATIKTQDGTIIQDIIGNSDQSLSFSRNYNYKSVGGSGANNIFYIQNQTGQKYISAYGELVVSGGNGGLGAFSGKWSFIIEQSSGLAQITLSSVTLDKSYNGGGTVTAVPGTTIKQMYIAFQSPTSPYDQNYCATLTVYPTQSYDGSGSDFSITAV